MLDSKQKCCTIKVPRGTVMMSRTVSGTPWSDIIKKWNEYVNAPHQTWSCTRTETATTDTTASASAAANSASNGTTQETTQEITKTTTRSMATDSTTHTASATAILLTPQTCIQNHCRLCQAKYYTFPRRCERGICHACTDFIARSDSQWIVQGYTSRQTT